MILIGMILVFVFLVMWKWWRFVTFVCNGTFGGSILHGFVIQRGWNLFNFFIHVIFIHTILWHCWTYLLIQRFRYRLFNLLLRRRIFFSTILIFNSLLNLILLILLRIIQRILLLIQILTTILISRRIFIGQKTRQLNLLLISRFLSLMYKSTIIIILLISIRQIRLLFNLIKLDH